MSIQRSYGFINSPDPLSAERLASGKREIVIHGRMLNHALDGEDSGDECQSFLDAQMEHTSFEELSIVTHYACPHAVRIAGRFLSYAGSSSDSDTSLDVRATTPNGLLEIESMVRSNSPLSTLKIRQNGLTDWEVSSFAESLKENTRLAALDLSNNEMTQVGLASLARALESNQTIRSLDLRFNLFGEEGVTILGDLLQRNSSLTEIDVAQGFEARRLGWRIAPMMDQVSKEVHPSLKEGLERNRENEIRHRTLFHMLQEKLEQEMYPQLSFTKLTEKDVETLEEIVIRHPHLRSFNLSQVRAITKKGRDALLRLLARHPYITSLGSFLDQRRSVAAALARIN